MCREDKVTGICRDYWLTLLHRLVSSTHHSVYVHGFSIMDNIIIQLSAGSTYYTDIVVLCTVYSVGSEMICIIIGEPLILPISA